MTSVSPCCNPRIPRVGLCALRSYLSPGIQVPELSRLFTRCSCLRHPQIQQPQGSLSIEPLRRFSTPSTNSFPSTTPPTTPTHREVRPQSHSQDGSILQPFRRQSRLPLRQSPRVSPLRFPPTMRQKPIHPRIQLTTAELTTVHYSSPWVSWAPSSAVASSLSAAAARPRLRPLPSTHRATKRPTSSST